MSDEISRILSAIEKAVLVEVSHDYSLPPNKIWVTEIAGCLRQAFFNRIMLREKGVGIAYSILRGRFFHEVVSRNLPIGITERNPRTKVKRLETSYEEIELRGRADIVAGSYVIDLKTSDRAPKEPLKEHINQIQLYMFLYEKNKGALVYLTKDGLVHFVIERDENLIQRLIEKAKALSKALRENRLPDGEVGPWCKWCPWAHPKYCREGAAATTTDKT